MKLITFIFACTYLLACNVPNERGNFKKPCNHDGTCNSDNLECNNLTSECSLKEKPVILNECRYESDCFCLGCAKRCGNGGVKSCVFSDTSVWGSKPALCECK